MTDSVHQSDSLGDGLAPAYDLMYLSPHLDDAALSCGGQIFETTSGGQAVLIVTLAAGEPPSGDLSQFAQSLHQRWELAAGAVATRRKEDIKACEHLGADYLHFDVPDCIYRRHPKSGAPLYASESAIFGELHDSEWPLIERLSAAMGGLPPAKRVLAPLGVGNHVDHQLTRRAAERWRGPSGLYYYEEYPYVTGDGALAAALGEENRWQASVIPISTNGLQARIEAIACYESQISTFFRDSRHLEEAVRSTIANTGGEQIWRFI